MKATIIIEDLPDGKANLVAEFDPPIDTENRTTATVLAVETIAFITKRVKSHGPMEIETE